MHSNARCLASRAISTFHLRRQLWRTPKIRLLHLISIHVRTHPISKFKMIRRCLTRSHKSVNRLKCPLSRSPQGGAIRLRSRNSTHHRPKYSTAIKIIIKSSHAGLRVTWLMTNKRSSRIERQTDKRLLKIIRKLHYRMNNHTSLHNQIWPYLWLAKLNWGFQIRASCYLKNLTKRIKGKSRNYTHLYQNQFHSNTKNRSISWLK